MSEIPPFTRETGLFVSAGEDGDELRLHVREGGLLHWHRWRFVCVNFETEPRWIAPIAYGVSEKEIYDAAEALRRAVDERKAATTPKGKR